MSAETAIKISRAHESHRRAAIIPDPLEGVIEGITRHERYCKFMTDVLSKIWPANSNSGEWGDDFHRTERFEQGDIGGYTQFSPFARDPKAISPDQFEAMVQNLGTADYVRVISTPPQILSPDTPIVNVGGSCVIETNGVRTVTELKKYFAGFQSEQEIKEYQAYLSEVAKRMINTAPTITHITGALLGGYNSGVHLIESDMWRERVEQEYGIPHEEAVQIVEGAYQRIHEAVQRRSRLINPNSTLIAVNFDELGLKDAIREWLAQIGLQGTDDHRVIEVIYTYVGPQQLDLLKKALSRRMQSGGLTDEEQPKAQNMLEVAYQVRGKQEDHLRWGSMNLPKDVIMGKREMIADEQEKFETDVAFRMGIVLMKAVYQAQKRNETQAIAVGFADLPTYGGGVQHEARDVGYSFTGKPGEQAFIDSVEQQLTNPARLHRLSIQSHLDLLRSYTSDIAQERAELTKRIGILSGTVNPVDNALEKANRALTSTQGQIEKYRQNIIGQQDIIDLTNFLLNSQATEITQVLIQTATVLIEQRKKALDNAQRKLENQRSENDINDLADLPLVIETLQEVVSGKKPTSLPNPVQARLQEMESTARRSIIGLQNQISTVETRLIQLQETQTEAQTAYNQVQPQREELTGVKAKLKACGGRSHFPLSDNPFVHHAMQFLWDSDFCIFLTKAVQIQGSLDQARQAISKQLKEIEKQTQLIIDGETTKGEAKDLSLIKQAETETTIAKKPLQQKEAEIRSQHAEQMRQLETVIFPKLEAYINYLYGRIDYPDTIRNSSVFTS